MLRKISRAIFPIVLVLTPISTHGQIRSPAQPSEIRGQLRFANGGAPAADVVVRLDQLAGGFVNEVRTDRLGKFRITNLSPIQYQVIIRHPGYQEIQREVNLIMTSSEYLQLSLVEDLPSNARVRVGSPGVIDANIPADARKEYERGEALVSSGDKTKIAESVRHFERAIAIHPAFLEAKLKLATTHMDLRQWTEAEKVLLAAKQAHPDTPNLLFALGELYLQQKKTDEAERVLRSGLQMEPRSWQGHFTLGRLYWNGGTGDIVKAARQVALALQLNPNFAEAHLLAGNIFLRAHKNAEAQWEFEEYLRLAPNGQFAGETKEIVQKIKKATAGRKP
ncbi:MAG TPA: tetratricopeptide repeat protein [Pyrinomonadaceae bacterium]|nr:tetratricopeptide repeat protein [Pyrinomonadaceae bacterium]